MTPEYLFWSAQAGLVRNVKRYLRKGGDPDVIEPRTGESALHIAALSGHLAVVEALLDNGADPTVEAGRRGTAADLARRQGRSDILELLDSRPVRRGAAAQAS